MNWRRGLLRVWIAMSALWIGLAGLLVGLGSFGHDPAPLTVTVIGSDGSSTKGPGWSSSSVLGRVHLCIKEAHGCGFRISDAKAAGYSEQEIGEYLIARTTVESVTPNGYGVGLLGVLFLGPPLAMLALGVVLWWIAQGFGNRT